MKNTGLNKLKLLLQKSQILYFMLRYNNVCPSLFTEYYHDITEKTMTHHSTW